MDKMRFADWLIIALLMLAPLAITQLGATYLLSPLISIAILALAALALDLVLTVCGFVSLGHAAFFALGGYVTGIGSYHFYEETMTPFGVDGWNDLLITLPLAFGIGAITAGLFGYASLRARGAYFIMGTLALAQMVYYFLTALEGYGGDDGLSLWWGQNTLAGVDASSKMAYAYGCLILLIAILFFVVKLANAPFGWVLQGGRENEARMEALGYRLYPYRLIAFALSGGIAAIAGALRVDSSGFMSPEIAHWSMSGELLVILIFGGMRRPTAALWGATALITLEYYASGFSSYWRLGLGLILLLTVLLARQGIAGSVQSAADFVSQKVRAK